MPPQLEAAGSTQSSGLGPTPRSLSTFRHNQESGFNGQTGKLFFSFPILKLHLSEAMTLKWGLFVEVVSTCLTANQHSRSSSTIQDNLHLFVSNWEQQIFDAGRPNHARNMV